ncbi:hypothetical protein B0H14DRAFT_921480 [Mycena olivaceomarginata]|nr:hypothetical protein B0H14DRAFT_921480 [Mycena olivaceomarginata]
MCRRSCRRRTRYWLRRVCWKHESDMDAVPQAPKFGRDWLRHVLRAGSTSMAIYREDSTSINCLTAPFSGNLAAPVTLTACTFHDYTINAQQNFTFAAGSSSVGLGAPGPIINSGYCFDVLTRTTNGTSVDFLGTSPCNGSLTQQWQVNNGSTINLAGTNRCIGQTTGMLGLNTQVQIADCIPGNANQNWSILRVASILA